jgi:hypothetical protein
MAKPKFRAGQVVFDSVHLVYGLLCNRPVKGVWLLVATRGIPHRLEYHVAEEDLRFLTKREVGR